MNPHAEKLDCLSYVGPAKRYDYMGAMQFFYLFNLGLRHYHTLLDFGCGSLRLGRFAIQYLDKGNYCGIEPKAKLIDDGIELNHLKELIEAKEPCIRISDDCDLTFFRKKFDYIIAHSIFTHMPQEQIKKSLKSARKIMTNDTLFLATYIEGKKDYKGETWTQNLTTYRSETMLKIIDESQLRVTILSLLHPHRQTWLLLRRTSVQ